MSVGSEKTIEFVDSLSRQAENVNISSTVQDSLGKQYNEKEYLNNIIESAYQFIEYGEWQIALENTLDNLCEVNYKLNSDLLDSAKAALLYSQDMGYPSDRLSLIKMMKLQDDMLSFKEYLTFDLRNAHDGLLREINYNYKRNKCEVEVSVDGPDGWVNLVFELHDVIEYCFKQRKNYTDVVLSGGIHADEFGKIFYFDFSPYSHAGEGDIDAYRKSNCYVACKRFSIINKAYRE